MSRRLVDFDRNTGIAHYSEWNELDDAFRFTAVQNVDNIIDFNKYQASLAPARFGDMAQVARIPMPLFQLLWSLGVIQDKKRFTAWCRDPSHRKFLTRSGKVI